MKKIFICYKNIDIKNDNFSKTMETFLIFFPLRIAVFYGNFLKIINYAVEWLLVYENIESLLLKAQLILQLGKFLYSQLKKVCLHDYNCWTKACLTGIFRLHHRIMPPTGCIACIIHLGCTKIFTSCITSTNNQLHFLSLPFTQLKFFIFRAHSYCRCLSSLCIGVSC